MEADDTYLVQSGLRLTFESLKLLQPHLFDSKCWGCPRSPWTTSYMSLQAYWRRCSGSLIQLSGELDHDNRAESAQRLWIHIVLSAFPLDFHPPAAKDLVLESSVYIKTKGYRTFQRKVASPGSYRVNWERFDSIMIENGKTKEDMDV